MRQGQQNRRGRGRSNNNNNNNNNRKGHNPLTRSFESTGPDVKIRGTPSHIAEKYMSLARDAQSSGDPVLAENYLQHAEHYNRIIMAFREQQVQNGGGDSVNGVLNRNREAGTGDAMESNADFGDDEGDDFNGDNPQNLMQARQSEAQPQPRMQNQPRGGYDGPRDRDRNRDRDRDGNRDGNRDRDGQRFDNRGHRGGHDNQNREHRPYRERQPHADQNTGDVGLSSAQPSPVPQRPENGGRGENGARRERFGASHEQPEFLRRPVRRPRRDADNGTETESVAESPSTDDVTSD